MAKKQDAEKNPAAETQTAEDIEAAVRAKMQAGLTRAQAEAVIQAQAEHDAAQ